MDKTNNEFDSKEYDDLFKLANRDSFDSEKLAVESYSYWSSVFKVFIRKKSTKIALGILATLFIFAILGPWSSPHDTSTNAIHAELRTIRPSLSNFRFFGTDDLGRDLFVTVFVALRFSFFLAILVSAINAITGIIIGSIWGFFRKIDPIMIEITNLLTNIPNLLIWLITIFVLTALGVSNNVAFIFALTIIGWVPMARIIRNQILIISDREYNLASKTLGTSSSKMIINNILPFILPVIITNISMAIPATVAAETSLSFFGLGLVTDAIALGPMLTIGFETWLSYPWILLAPAGILAMLTISFYLLGLALSDSLDPKLHR